jgi:phage shock protein PspC (stress-responsive transcriptional regulator)
MIAGVAGGLARHFGVDPTLMRVGFVVLTLFGGSGLILYLLLALMVPADDAGTDPLRHGRMKTGLIVVLVIAACIALPFSGPGVFFLSPIILVAAIGVVLYRAAGGQVDPRIMRASLVALSVIGAVVLGLGAATAVAFGGGAIVSGVVLGLGVVMVVAAFAGGARWLIAPALILAIPVAIVAAADIDLKGGVGERDYRPASVSEIRSEYRLGVGELRLDLRDVAFPDGVTTVDTHVGVGRTEVILPADVCLDSDVHVGVGDTRVLGRHNDGVDVDAMRREAVSGSAPVLRLKADSGLGEVVVHRGGDRFGPAGADQQSCAPR